MDEKLSKAKGIRDISSSKYKILQTLMHLLKEEYNLSKADVLNLFEDSGSINIPLYIFSGDLSPLEAIVKYLKENLQMKFSQIASSLNRDGRSIWQSYHHSQGRALSAERKDDIMIPISIFKNRELSILENLTVHLKDDLSIDVKEIAALIGKKPSTIWTAYNRAKKKKNG